MGVKNRRGSNNEEQGREGLGSDCTGFPDPRTAYKWDMWLDTQNVNKYQGGIPLYG